MAEPRLQRSSTDSIVFGVCGGLAEYFHVDPVLVRLVFVVLTLVGGSGIVLYIVLAIIMPKQESVRTEPREVVRENLETMGQDIAEAGRRVGRTSGTSAAEPRARNHRTVANGLGLLLIVLGVIFLLRSLGLFWWWRWDIFLPLLLIGLGVLLMVGYLRRRA